MHISFDLIDKVICPICGKIYDPLALTRKEIEIILGGRGCFNCEHIMEVI